MRSMSRRLELFVFLKVVILIAVISNNIFASQDFSEIQDKHNDDNHELQTNSLKENLSELELQLERESESNSDFFKVDNDDSDETATNYFVKTKFCLIPRTQLFNDVAYEALKNSSLSKFRFQILHPRDDSIQKQKTCVIKKDDNSFLMVTPDNSTTKAKDPISCCAIEIIPTENQFQGIHQIIPCQKIPSTGLQLTQLYEFLQIKCTSKEGTYKPTSHSKYSTEFYANLVPKLEAIKKKKFWTKLKSSVEELKKSNFYYFLSNLVPVQPPSILLIGIDSTSTNEAIRSFPKTIDFLKSENFLTFRGYTKLGETISSSIFPILTGCSPSEFIRQQNTEIIQSHPNRGNKSKSRYKISKCKNVFDKFSALNYITLNGLRLPTRLQTENYNRKKHGEDSTFTADYNLEPFINLATKWRSRSNHFNSIKNSNFYDTSNNFRNQLLNYTINFLQNYNKAPTFGAIWLPKKEEVHQLHQTDNELFNFFQEIQNLTQDSLVILLSEKGMSSSFSYKRTAECYVEENLPLFMVKLPMDYEKRFPWMSYSFLKNVFTLTTPHDVHETLLETVYLACQSLNSVRKVIPNFDTNFKQVCLKFFKEREQDVFKNKQRFRNAIWRPMSDFRNCASAKIPEKYCLCGLQTDQSLQHSQLKYHNQKNIQIGRDSYAFVTNDKVKKAAIYLKNYINNYVKLQLRELYKSELTTVFDKQVYSHVPEARGFEKIPIGVWNERVKYRQKCSVWKLDKVVFNISLLENVNQVSYHEIGNHENENSEIKIRNLGFDIVVMVKLKGRQKLLKSIRENSEHEKSFGFGYFRARMAVRAIPIHSPDPNVFDYTNYNLSFLDYPVRVYFSERTKLLQWKRCGAQAEFMNKKLLTYCNCI